MIKISFNGDVREFASEGKSYIELISSVDPKLLSSYVAVKEKRVAFPADPSGFPHLPLSGRDRGIF